MGQETYGLTMGTDESPVAATKDKLISCAFLGYPNINKILDRRHAILHIKCSCGSDERFDSILSIT